MHNRDEVLEKAVDATITSFLVDDDEIDLYTDGEELNRIRDTAYGSVNWACSIPKLDPQETPEAREKRFQDYIVQRAVTYTQHALKGLSEKNAIKNIDAVLDLSASHLVNALKDRRNTDSGGLAELSQQQAYDLGMQGTLVALDKIKASIEYETPDGINVTQFGGLANLFDEINS